MTHGSRMMMGRPQRSVRKVCVLMKGLAVTFYEWDVD